MSAQLPSFRKILVVSDIDEPKDFSFALLKRLRTQDQAADVMVVSFAEKLPFYTSIPSEERRSHLQELIVDEVREKTKTRCKRFIEKFELSIQVGRDLETLIEEIKRFAPDLVVKNEDHVDGIFEKGATTGFDLKLARECPSPLLLMDRTLDKGDAVACAIDPEPDDDVRNDLSSDVVDYGLALANLNRTDLFVVRAWRALGEQLLSSRGRMTKEEVTEYIDSIKTNIRSKFDEILDSKPNVAGTSIQTEFHHGDPIPVIGKVIKEKNIGLVVIGSVARKGLPGYLLGNTAETVVQSATCSVLIIKPKHSLKSQTQTEGDVTLR